MLLCSFSCFCLDKNLKSAESTSGVRCSFRDFRFRLLLLVSSSAKTSAKGKNWGVSDVKLESVQSKQ